MLGFKTVVICDSLPSQGNDSWVEDALRRAKYLVSEVSDCPEHAKDCEHGRYLKELADVVPR